MSFAAIQTRQDSHLSSDIMEKDWFSTAIPTPPPSDHGYPYPDGTPSPGASVTVSTVFYPGADLPWAQDIALLTKDGVYFYVNLDKILANSYNAFNGLLHDTLQCQTPNVGDVAVVHIDEPSDVLNVIIHAIFDMSCAAYAPSLDTMIEAISRMPTYGLYPPQYLAPSSPLFPLLLGQAPLHGMRVYALAAEYQLEALAVPVSSHLLSFPLSSINDDLAQKIGPVYLRRLFFMHIGRVEALKRLLKSPPYPHPPTLDCDFTAQKNVSRAWSLAAAYIVWDSRPDTSNSTIKAAFAGFVDQLVCDECKLGLTKRLDEVVVNWSQVKCTI